MTAPTITYGHGVLEECDDATGWSENLTNMLGADATLTVENGDVFKIEAIFDDGATDENVYYRKIVSGWATKSPTTYNKWLIRYKTSESANGAKAKVVIEFADATSETLLSGNYSTSWATASGSISKSGSNIKYIRFYADDDGTDGTFYVYYDFLLIHKGTFTFPYCPENVRLETAKTNLELPISERVGGITQPLGGPLSIFRIRGNMEHEQRTTWQTQPTGSSSSGSVYGEVFYTIVHESDLWQWFTSDLGDFKVTVEQFNIEQAASKTEPVQRRYELVLKEYRLSDASTENAPERFGI